MNYGRFLTPIFKTATDRIFCFTRVLNFALARILNREDQTCCNSYSSQPTEKNEMEILKSAKGVYRDFMQIYFSR